MPSTQSSASIDTLCAGHHPRHDRGDLPQPSWSPPRYPAAPATCAVHRTGPLDLPHEDGTFDAAVSNLPFGRQFPVEDPACWLRQALAELARVTRPGGHVVVLVPPPVPRGVSRLDLTGTYSLRLLGVSTRIGSSNASQHKMLTVFSTIRTPLRHAHESDSSLWSPSGHAGIPRWAAASTPSNRSSGSADNSSGGR
jgi:SAM-dependent methyltransferase